MYEVCFHVVLLLLQSIVQNELEHMGKNMQSFTWSIGCKCYLPYHGDGVGGRGE